VGWWAFRQGCAGPPVDLEGVALSEAQRELCRGGLEERQLRKLKALVPHRPHHLPSHPKTLTVTLPAIRHPPPLLVKSPAVIVAGLKSNLSIFVSSSFFVQLF
jgi:hypothetical protein